MTNLNEDENLKIFYGNLDHTYWIGAELVAQVRSGPNGKRF